VTIATNMAGRGTDIILGGNPAGLASDLLHQRGLNPAEVDKATYDAAFGEAKAITDEDHARVVEAGGLHIIGTERHESRRIDNQLRGRAGRQGDPGSSRFYLSLDDDLMKRFASDRVTSIMERLGLDDDTYIESGIVGKTIESAQSRVEGFNFDMRKRVVEFDDVINRQRETIYAERDKVLRNEDLTETVQSFLDDEVRSLVEMHLGGDNPDDWGMEALGAALRAMGLDGQGTSEDDLWEIGNRDAILEHLLDVADAKLAAKEAEIGEADWSMVERLVLLRTIDSLWVEHLTEIDDMRRGIGLRGYAQQDPLNEFRREAYRLYEELRGLIRHQLASTIFRVTVTRTASEAPPAEMVGAVPFGASSGSSATTSGSAGAVGLGSGAGAAGGSATGLLGSSAGGGAAGGSARPAPPIAGGLAADPMAQALRQRGGDGASGQAKPGFTPSGARIGRNDACWCGSGLKYKKCHGR
jgi:preprotein translocase subunit SecA